MKTSLLGVGAVVLLSSGHGAAAPTVTKASEAQAASTQASVKMGVQEDMKGGMARVWYSGRVPGSTTSFYDLFDTNTLATGGTSIVVRRYNGKLVRPAIKDDTFTYDPKLVLKTERFADDALGNVFVVYTYHDAVHNKYGTRLVRFAASGGIGFDVEAPTFDMSMAIAPDGTGGVYVIGSNVAPGGNLPRYLTVKRLSPTGAPLFSITDSKVEQWATLNMVNVLNAVATPTGVYVTGRTCGDNTCAQNRLNGLRSLFFKNDGTKGQDTQILPPSFPNTLDPIVTQTFPATDGSPVMVVRPQSQATGKWDAVFLHFDPSTGKYDVLHGGPGTVGRGAHGEIVRMHVDDAGKLAITHYGVVASALKVTGNQTSDKAIPVLDPPSFDIAPNTGVIAIPHQSSIRLLRSDATAIGFAAGTVFGFMTFAVSDGINEASGFSAAPVGRAELTFSPGAPNNIMRAP